MCVSGLSCALQAVPGQQTAHQGPLPPTAPGAVRIVNGPVAHSTATLVLNQRCLIQPCFPVFSFLNGALIEPRWVFMLSRCYLLYKYFCSKCRLAGFGPPEGDEGVVFKGSFSLAHCVFISCYWLVVIEADVFFFFSSGWMEMVSSVS